MSPPQMLTALELVGGALTASVYVSSDDARPQLIAHITGDSHRFVVANARFALIRALGDAAAWEVFRSTLGEVETGTFGGARPTRRRSGGWALRRISDAARDESARLFREWRDHVAHRAGPPANDNQELAVTP